MPVEKVETLIVGGGQAGLMMSAQLRQRGRPHLILERHRIAERWRTERWDALHANGPAWHDRFPDLLIAGVDPDGFATRDQMADYFTAYAAHIAAPIRCGVAVTALHRKSDGTGFQAETSPGAIEATNVVAATGPFQRGIIPPLVPPDPGITQMHSTAYRNPDQLPPGAVLVVGAGSSGTQIADELSRAGRRVYLCVGQHERPPRRYRGKDFCFWLGVLGLWDAETRDPAKEHVTIAVSGAYGGHTIDFRRLAARGITLLGRAHAFGDGAMRFAPAWRAISRPAMRTIFPCSTRPTPTRRAKASTCPRSRRPAWWNRSRPASPTLSCSCTCAMPRSPRSSGRPDLHSISAGCRSARWTRGGRR